MDVYLIDFNNAENGLVRPCIGSSCISYGYAIKEEWKT